MKYKLIGIFVVLLLTFSGASDVFAIDLADAKDQGLIAEKTDGLLAASESASATIKNLVNTINSRRLVQYKTISRRNGQPVSVIQQKAGEKTVGRTERGQFYVNKAGRWVQK